MKLIKLLFNLKTRLLILAGLVLSYGLYADSPCESFVAKIVYITRSDRQDTGYIYLQRYRDDAMLFNYVDENFTINNRIPLSQIDFSKIKEIDTACYRRIIAVNRSVMKDTSISKESNGYIDIKRLPVVRCIYDFRYTTQLITLPIP
jgi:hypothetical protein